MEKHVVKTRLTDEEKENWLLYCQSSGISQSDMLRMMINRASPNTKFTEPFKETKTDKVTVRLSEYSIKMIQEQARYEGYLNQSQWVRAAVLSKLSNTPVLSNAEIDALRDSNRHITALGRNLNQIARVLNTNFRHSDKITKEMIEKLKNDFDRHTKKVNQLVAKSSKRWGADNDSLAS